LREQPINRQARAR